MNCNICSYTFAFNYIYTFKLLTSKSFSNVDIDDILLKSNIIVACREEDEMIIRDFYQQMLDSRKIKFEELNESINNSIISEINDSVNPFSVHAHPVFEGIEKRIIDEGNTISTRENELFGKKYNRYCLLPFIIYVQETFIKGTSTLTYLGSNIFSLHISAYELSTRLTYEDAVHLSYTYFKEYEISFAHDSQVIGKGIDSLVDMYKQLFALSLGKEIVLYSNKSYEVLTGIDYWPCNDIDIFYYLHQPLSKERLSSINDKYISDTINDSELSHYKDFRVNAYTNRMLISVGKILEYVNNKNENTLSNEDITFFLTDQQANFILPLQRALGSYCLVNDLNNSIKDKTIFKASNIDLIRISLNHHINSYLFDEDYRYSTVSDTIDKIREIIKFGEVLNNIKIYMEFINSMVEEKQKKSDEYTKNLLTAFLGLLSVLLSLSAINDWIQLLQKLGFVYSILHPFRLTGILIGFIFIITFTICYRLIRKRNYKIDFNKWTSKSTNNIILDRIVKH